MVDFPIIIEKNVDVPRWKSSNQDLVLIANMFAIFSFLVYTKRSKFDNVSVLKTDVIKFGNSKDKNMLQKLSESIQHRIKRISRALSD